MRVRGIIRDALLGVLGLVLLAGCGAEGGGTTQGVTGNTINITCSQLPKVGQLVLTEDEGLVRVLGVSVRGSVVETRVRVLAQESSSGDSTNSTSGTGPVTITTEIDGPVCPVKSGNTKTTPLPLRVRR